MVKKNINGWGNSIKKTLTVVDDLQKYSGLLSIGNNNSYGDAAVPQSSIFKSTKFNDSSFLDINLTVNEYLDNYKKIPFGTPGKSNVTLAGAIASDVHGKMAIGVEVFKKILMN